MALVYFIVMFYKYLRYKLTFRIMVYLLLKAVQKMRKQLLPNVSQKEI